MAAVVRIKSGGSCCPCPQQIGCSCSAVPCTIECRSKSGIATLCGFEENDFGVPSAPPNRFRKKRITGSLDTCAFPNSDCSPISLTYPSSFSKTHTFSPGDPDYPAGGTGAVVFYSAALSLGGASGGGFTYTAVCVATANEGGGAVPVGVFITASGPSGIVTFINGDSHVLLPGDYDIHVGIFYGIGNPYFGDDHMSVPGQLISGVHDLFDQSSIYSQATCAVTEENLSTRQTGTGVTCPITPGDLVDGGPTIPDLTIVSKTRREHVAGENCIDNGDGTSSKAIGTVTEDLVDQDSEDDAITRANAGISDFTLSNCLTSPAFKTQRGPGDIGLEYRFVQSRAHLTGLINHRSYDVTTNYYRRIHNSLGPWIFFSLNTQTVTPISEGGDDPNSMFSAWTDVPSEPGFETRAQFCAVLLIP